MISIFIVIYAIFFFFNFVQVYMYMYLQTNTCFVHSRYILCLFDKKCFSFLFYERKSNIFILDFDVYTNCLFISISTNIKINA